MRKVYGVLVFAVALSLALSASPAYAKKGEKGASQSAYEHASDQAIFNRVGDWFATVGKSEEEKEAILMERRAQRATKRAEKAARQLGRQADQETQKTQRMAEKEAQNAKKKLQGFGK